jgi:hypothetical protein
MSIKKFNGAIKVKSKSEIIEEIIKTANDKYQFTTEDLAKIAGVPYCIADAIDNWELKLEQKQPKYNLKKFIRLRKKAE